MIRGCGKEGRRRNGIKGKVKLGKSEIEDRSDERRDEMKRKKDGRNKKIKKKLDGWIRLRDRRK